MSTQKLVSIIIPTYNRAHLISETLDSIIAQTYPHWECIVVDDGSTDGTNILMQSYIKMDARFKYFSRPDTHLSGGNGARNYGFEMSRGSYIQWFDSDDLMEPEKLYIKVNTIEKFNVDFVISQTRYFNAPDKKTYLYNYREEDINFLSYSTTHISWFTPDMLIKSAIAKNIGFNEFIKAGQEYNYSCKLVLNTNKIKKVENFLTLRRFHLDSIGKKRQSDRQHFYKTNFDLHWETLNELTDLTDSLPIRYKKYALYKCLKSYIKNHKLKNTNRIKLPPEFHKTLYLIFGIKSIYFYLAIIADIVFKKNHSLLVRIKK